MVILLTTFESKELNIVQLHPLVSNIKKDLFKKIEIVYMESFKLITFNIFYRTII